MTEWPAFFTLSGGTYVPRPPAFSLWSANVLSGPPVCGMIARELEIHHLAEEFVPARLTVDLCRPVPAAPLTVVSTPFRSGRRIRVVDATVLANGTEPVARATATFLRKSTQPAGAVWRRQRTSPVPHPVNSGHPAADTTPMYGSDGHEHGWSGDISDHQNATRKRIWVRRIAAVEGEKPSPFVCAAIVGEQTSFVANWGSAGVEFINTDVTLALARLPTGTELGVEADNHISSEGVAACAGTLYDRDGPVGACTVTAIVHDRRRLTSPLLMKWPTDE